MHNCKNYNSKIEKKMNKKEKKINSIFVGLKFIHKKKIEKISKLLLKLY